MGHQAAVDLLLCQSGELGQLDAGVDAQALAVILAVGDGRGVPVGAQDLDHVGQVVLVLGVLAANLANVGGEKRAVKGVAAGVALQQVCVLLGRAVLLLDDADDVAVGGLLDAAVAKGVGRGHGEDGGGVAAVAHGVGKRADGRWLDQGQVSVENDDGAGGDSGGFDCDARCVARTQALGLLDALDVWLLGQVSAHFLGAVAYDNDNPLGSGVARCARDPGDERTVKKLMHNLGVTGLHARTLARSEDDRGHGHVSTASSERKSQQNIPSLTHRGPFVGPMSILGKRCVKNSGLPRAGWLLLQWAAHRGIVQWLGQRFLVPSMRVRVLLPLPL